VHELVDGDVDGGQDVSGTSASPEDPAGSSQDHLAPSPLGDAGVPLLGDVDLGPFERGTEPAEPADLLCNQGLLPFGDRLPSGGDHDVHVLPPIPGAPVGAGRCSLPVVRRLPPLVFQRLLPEPLWG
jgi:hypothetical protein